MTEPSQTPSRWKEAIRESGAIGWIALGVLIVAVLIGALTFGQKPKVNEAQVPAQSTSQ
jgi:hypothetical protein